eukprot:1196376-Prorocentrum_minimum.AAC.1
MPPVPMKYRRGVCGIIVEGCPGVRRVSGCPGVQVSGCLGVRVSGCPGVVEGCPGENWTRWRAGARPKQDCVRPPHREDPRDCSGESSIYPSSSPCG